VKFLRLSIAVLSKRLNNIAFCEDLRTFAPN
jgi:hypothetical protein